MLVLALVAGCGSDEPTLMERAQSLVEGDGGFGTAIESGDTFAHVGELLLEAAEACSVPCPGLRQASAYVQVIAVEVLECTQPGVHDARAAVLAYLSAVAAAPASTDVQPPALPDC